MNATLMVEVLRQEKKQRVENEIVDQINHARLNKKFHFPLELVGAKGRSRAETIDKKDSKSQFEFPSVEKP